MSGPLATPTGILESYNSDLHQRKNCLRRPGSIKTQKYTHKLKRSEKFWHLSLDFNVHNEVLRLEIF